jgi:glycosidase
MDYAAGKSGRQMAANLELMREAYPPQAFSALMNLLSTHDQPRALHHFGEDQDLALAKQRLRLAVFFQMTYPGAPTIYYGDEVGLGGGDDPYNRAPYPWADEGGQPDDALLTDFKRLVKLRHDLPVLRHGTLDAPLHADDQVVVLARQSGKTWALTATNNSTTARTVSVIVPLASGTLRDALGGAPVAVDNHRIQLTVPPLFGRVLTAELP